MDGVNDMAKNGSGYVDPTALHAMVNAEPKKKPAKTGVDRPYDPEETRFHRFLKALFMLAELCGYHIEGRLTVKDVKTGRVWK